MSRGDKKREQLFQRYSENLFFLKENKVLPDTLEIEEGDYVCPICLDIFTKEDLDQKTENPLSLEDAPPKSLGGSQIVLTCQDCNNGMGRDIDWHLTERLRELDFREQVPGAESEGRFVLDISVNGKIVVEADGTTKAHLSKTNNHPETLERYIALISGENRPEPRWFPRPSRVNAKKLQIAILKNAYLLMFEKFGYAFLFDSEYDRIREQLLQPEADIYPLNCWFQGPFPEEHIGVPFITEKKMESIFVLFRLSTKLKERLFGAVLPLSSSKIEKTIAELSRRFETEKEFTVEMSSFTDNYLNDIESIHLLLEYMKKYR